MRHRKAGRRLKRTSEHRKATMKALTVSLFRHSGITTTDAKAKELRRFAEQWYALQHGSAYDHDHSVSTTPHDYRVAERSP